MITENFADICRVLSLGLTTNEISNPEENEYKSKNVRNQASKEMKITL